MKFSELSEQQSEALYQKLVEKAKTFESDDNNGLGVSDGHELVNHHWVQMAEKDLEVPEDLSKFSAGRHLRSALLDLTGGTAPSREGQNGRLKYGKFEQQEAFDTVQPEPYVHESDLDEAMTVVSIMMDQKHYSTLFDPEVGMVACGGVMEFAKANGIEKYNTALQRVNRARKDFLACIPQDSQLFTYTRRLRTKYGVTV